MGSTTRKRKAPDSLEEFTKRLRIDNPASIIQAKTSTNEYTQAKKEEDEEEEDGDKYQREHYESSEDENTADTPVTPFSPVRKKFPSELKTIKCTYEGCPKTFNRPARLTAHLRSHTNERPFTCPYEDCDKAYLQDKHLQHHIKGSHTKEREHRCDIEGCRKSFMTSTRLKRHKEAHKGRDRFRCTNFPPCNQSFRKHQTLQRHIRSDHMNLTPFSCTYVDPITNIPCNAGFDGSNGLRQHMERIHSDSRARFFCSECAIPDVFSPNGSPLNPSFTSEARLQAHIRKEHAQCLFCDQKCSSQHQLLEHIETQHSGKSLEERKTHQCTYIGCGKKFTKANNLQTHIRTAHMGERFICGTFDLSSHPDTLGFENGLGCGSELVSKQSLIDHIRVTHLNIPTINNQKKVPASYYDDDGDSEFKSTKNSRKGAPQATAIDHLLGLSQSVNPARNIPCSKPGCGHLFIRDYDLQVHLRSAIHNNDQPFTSDPNCLIDPALLALSSEQPIMTNVDENTGVDLNTDIDWELQHQATEGGPFWVGAEEDVEGQDEWVREASEMRRLIGRGD